jgi:hypothetical protein
MASPQRALPAPAVLTARTHAPERIAEDKQWRVRLAIIEYIPFLASQVRARLGWPAGLAAGMHAWRTALRVRHGPAGLAAGMHAWRTALRVRHGPAGLTAGMHAWRTALRDSARRYGCRTAACPVPRLARLRRDSAHICAATRPTSALRLGPHLRRDSQLGTNFFDEKLGPLCMSWLGSALKPAPAHPAAVRMRTMSGWPRTTHSGTWRAAHAALA